MPKLKPQQAAPDLSFPVLDGDACNVREQAIDQFLMVVVYRGLHCPVCKTYLRQLDRLVDEYAGSGIAVVSVSADSEERARQAKDEWGIKQLRVGYGLTEPQMREWDMFVSHAIKEKETATFAEPALFLLKPDHTLYYSAYSSLPFGRPDLKELLGKIQWVIENDYPARGEA